MKKIQNIGIKNVFTSIFFFHENIVKPKEFLQKNKQRMGLEEYLLYSKVQYAGVPKVPSLMIFFPVLQAAQKKLPIYCITFMVQ